MGLLSWWKGESSTSTSPSQSNSNYKPQTQTQTQAAEISGLNGAVEVPRPTGVTVFEFGSVSSSSDKVTLAGFCPVSDDLEPCRWEILPASGSDAPLFRVVF